MTMYDRTPAEECVVVDRWDGGLGWVSHPEETGVRASHAFVDEDDGVWVVDPLEAPGVDDVLDSLGTVTGVVVLSNYHARDAEAFATRYDVPIYLPSWLSRAADRIERPVRTVTDTIGSSGFAVRRYAPFPGWSEAIAYREADGTLYVPDALGTAPLYTVGDERLGTYLLCRLTPPRDAFDGVTPRRILVGHGTGVFEDAASALAEALDGARRGFPKALWQNGWGQLRALTEALGAA
ncbi:hypothetical protein [Halobellus litoreus]|uniref:Glyoxylase, beta-lactamase superfamily II n=1 Tax=Halobellus litoreus TaxID=755310 RepID=A0ABD6DSH5_9EURY|nr:hypothetical protein [Halobellus litoreus]